MMELWREGTEIARDMLLHNGDFITINEEQPLASALAIKKGRLLKVGTYDVVKPLLGENANMIDLAGRTTVPFFIDSHVHLISLGLGMQVIDLGGVTSRSGILAMLDKSAEDIARIRVEMTVIGGEMVFP